MRRRLLRAMVAVAVAAVVVLGLPLGFVAGRVVRTDVIRTLDREADAIGFAIDDSLERGAPVDPETVRRQLRPGRYVVVTDAKGRKVTAGAPIAGRTIQADITTVHGGRITMEASAMEADRRSTTAWLVVLGLAVGAILAAVALALVETRRLSRPLDDLAAASARLGAGNFSGRAPRSGLPEVDAVAATLDSSADRIADLVRAEREFASNASHQLRTPLTALRMRVEESLAAPSREEAREESEAALREADRLEATITALLAVARGREAGGRRQLDIAALVDAWAQRWRPLLAKDHNRTLRVVTSARPTANVSEAVVGQVLDVLADNARRHGAGTVTVEVRVAAQHAVVRVSDEGPGVPDGMERAVFDRHVSGTGGTGVGLAVARVLAESAGGRLELVSARPAVFELYLPGVVPRERPPVT